jgi:O-antigen ligase
MKKKELTTRKSDIIFWAYILFLISVVFCFRAVTSITIGVILFISVTGTWKSADPRSKEKSLRLFLLSCALLFGLECLSSLYTTNISEQWVLLKRSSGIVLTPLAVLVSLSFLTPEKFQKLLAYFTLILAIGGIYCLLVTTIKFLLGAPASMFFYHDLVKPLSQHAIQFSIMTFIGLVWTIENPMQKSEFYPSWLFAVIVPFLSIFLVLLSSKLIITVYILYLLSFFLQKHPYKARRWPIYIVFLALTTLMFTTKNPVGNRFRAVLDGNSMLFEQQTFNPGISFNGLQFRLIQWRFTADILSEQHAWIVGLTPGDTQSHLDRKYVDEHMYTGAPGSRKRGFLGYHTHNQFLQSLLENGLPALLIFILICYSLILMAKQGKSRVLSWVVGLMIIYCFTDATLKTQYGIVIFTFFPSLLYAAPRPKENSSTLQLGRTRFNEHRKQPH